MGIVWSLLYMGVFLWAGWRLSRRLFPEGDAVLCGCLTASFSLAMLAMLPAAFALIFGFTLPAALLGGVAALGAGLWARGPKGLPPLGEQWRPFVLCVGPLLALGLLLLYTHTLYMKDGGYWCGQSTYGDLAMHLAFIKSIAVQGNFPPSYPLLAGQTLFGYPFMCETVSSVFLLLGASLKTACILPQAVALAAVFGMGWQFAYRVLGSAGKAALAYWLFFMGSGFGFAYFFGGDSGNFTRIFTEFYETPTNYVQENVRWVNPIADMLIPQRATLFGWALLFAALYLLYRFAFEGEHRLWLALGLLAGCLPLVHTHSLLALVLVSAVYFGFAIWDARQKGWATLRPWLGYILVAGALCLPQLFLIIFRQTSTGNNFLRLHWNWSNEGDNYFWFYIKNIGIVYLLLIPAFLSANRRLRRLYAGGLAILVVAECVVFQPNTYDNNKLLFIWHLLGCILVAELLPSLFASLASKPARAFCMALVLAVGTVGSVLTLGREVVSSYQQFGADDLAVTAFVEQDTPKDALFLTGTQHLNPVVSLAGRSIVCGSSLYTYFHGMDYAQEEADVRTLYTTPDEALLQQYGIDYVVFSSWERNDFDPVDEAFYATRYPVVYQQGSYTIYQVSQAG